MEEARSYCNRAKNGILFPNNRVRSAKDPRAPGGEKTGQMVITPKESDGVPLMTCFKTDPKTKDVEAWELIRSRFWQWFCQPS